MSFLYDFRHGVAITCPRCLTRFAVKYAVIVQVKFTKCFNCGHVWAHHYAKEMPEKESNNDEVVMHADRERSIENKSIDSLKVVFEENSGKFFDNMRVENGVSVENSLAKEKGIRPKSFAVILMIFMALILSFSGLIFRSMEQPDIWQISIFRGIALICAIGFFLIFKFKKRALGQLLEMGFSGFFAGAVLGGAQLCYMESMDNTSIANATFTISIIPLLTAFLAKIFLGEQLRVATLITMMIAMVGIIIMVHGSFGSGSGYGIFMAVMTAFLFSSFAVTVRKKRDINMVPALLFSGIVNAVAGLMVIGGEINISGHDILLSFVWGAGMQALGFSLFIIASRYFVAAEVTLFSLLELSIGPMWVWFLLGETPVLATLVGGGIVIVSILSKTLFELTRPLGLKS